MIENFKNFSAHISDDDPIKVLLVGETYCDGSFFIERKCSDLMALEYIIDGAGELQINGQELKPEAGDVFFLELGSNHKYFTSNDYAWHKYWIVFDGKMATTMAELYLPKNTYLFKNCNVKKHFERIFQLAEDDISYERMVHAVTLELLQIFMYIKACDKITNEGIAHLIRKKLDEAVEKHFNLDELCREINYSKNYIINIFKAEYSVTPYQYYMDRKIDAAKMYLMHTNISVGDISKILHYSDQQYFSSCFKRTVGYSPLAFRRLARK